MEPTKLSAEDQKVLKPIYEYLNHETVVYSYQVHASCVVDQTGFVIYQEFGPSGQPSEPDILKTDGVVVKNIHDEILAKYVEGEPLMIVSED